MITKRIDLALLEAQEIGVRLITALVLGGCAVLLASAAWFGFSAALAWTLVAEGSPALRLASFAGLNAIGAALVIAPALRLARAHAGARETAAGNGQQKEPNRG